MPQTCSVCKHPDLSAIEVAIISGTSLRNIAKQFSCSATAIYRHKENCLKPAVTATQADMKSRQTFRNSEGRFETPSEEEPPAFDALTEMEWMRRETKGIYKAVSEMGDYKISLQALAELRRQNELCAKLVGELDEHSITITAIPEWRELRALLLDALSRHPQAKMDVIRALEAYDHAQSA